MTDPFKEAAAAFTHRWMERDRTRPEANAAIGQNRTRVIKDVCPMAEMRAMFDNVLDMMARRDFWAALPIAEDNASQIHPLNPAAMGDVRWDLLAERLSGGDSEALSIDKIYAGAAVGKTDFDLARARRDFDRHYFRPHEAAFALEALSLQPQIFLAHYLLITSFALYADAGVENTHAAQAKNRLTREGAEILIDTVFNAVSIADDPESVLLPAMATVIFARAKNPAAPWLEPPAHADHLAAMEWMRSLNAFREKGLCPAAGRYTKLLTMPLREGTPCLIAFLEKAEALIAGDARWAAAAGRLSEDLLYPLAVSPQQPWADYCATPSAKAIAAARATKKIPAPFPGRGLDTLHA